MRKIIYRTIIIFIMISAMYVTKAYATGSFNISASKSSINKGESVTVSIKANNAYGQVDIKATNGTVNPSTVFLQTGSDTKTVTVTSTSDADIEVTATPGSNGLGDIDENPITGSQKLTIKVNKTNTSTDNNQGNQNTNTGNNNSGTMNSGANGNSATTATKSKEARLKSLGITPNDFSGFSKNTDKEDWNVEVPNDVTKVKVYATAKDSKAKVTGTGDVNLKEGENTVKITVTAEAGNTKTYTLKITRKAAESTENNNTDAATTSKEEFGLSSLEIKDVEISPSFKTEKYEYTATLQKDIDQLDIATIPTDDDTTVEIAGNENLKEGENVITIVVQNKKKDETVTYQITVNKKLQGEQVENTETSTEKEARNILKPSTWGKEEIIKLTLIAVLIILIIIAIILKIKLSKEKKVENEIEFPGADELDKAITEHQELSEQENKEYINSFYYDENEEIEENKTKSKRKGKHF